MNQTRFNDVPTTLLREAITLEELRHRRGDAITVAAFNGS